MIFPPLPPPHHQYAIALVTPHPHYRLHSVKSSRASLVLLAVLVALGVLINPALAGYYPISVVDLRA